MKLKGITIDQNILSILKDEKFDDFTVTQLKEAFAASLRGAISGEEARKVVYRQVLRLLKIKVIKKDEATNARNSIYSKTAKFSKLHFIPRESRYTERAQSITTNNRNSGLIQIEEQLKQYKVDFLTSVGESEEYMRLYKSNPELKSLLETEYHQAREQSSKLLGQIKALKNILSHYSS
jgi:hypothetical protein